MSVSTSINIRPLKQQCFRVGFLQVLLLIQMLLVGTGGGLLESPSSPAGVYMHGNYTYIYIYIYIYASASLLLHNFIFFL